MTDEELMLMSKINKWVIAAYLYPITMSKIKETCSAKAPTIRGIIKPAFTKLRPPTQTINSEQIPESIEILWVYNCALFASLIGDGILT